MPLADLIREGERVMTVCNSCRYCEQYCPVFPAMEQRLTFTQGDLTYLANLCHNCGDCLYACQYAPPHEFGINVPRTLAKIRLASSEDYCWPRWLAVGFKNQSVLTSIALAAVLSVVILASTWLLNPDGLLQADSGGDFYAVVPHAVMVTLFGGVSLFVIAAIAIAVTGFWREANANDTRTPNAAEIAHGLRDAMTLRHLHSTGIDCTNAEDVRTPWRRVWHHGTFYGFILCFASTTVAAVYHSAFGWHAPYEYTSVPVVLGTLGGLGLLVGPAGLLWQRHQRDPELGAEDRHGLDESFITLLFVTSLTGLLLLVLRESRYMPSLLIVHLGVVLALFLTLPYGKFVHGFYRIAALIKHAREQRVE